MAAVGATDGAPKAKLPLGGCGCCAFNAGAGTFTPKLPPTPDDWLADRAPGAEERGGQSFAKFMIDVGVGSRASVRRAAKYMPSAARHVLYVADADSGGSGGAADDDEGAPPLALLADFVGRWFGLPCRVLDSAPPPNKKAKPIP